MNKKSQIILVFIGLVFLFCFTSCAGILNEFFGLEPTNIEDTILDSFAVYRINDSYSYIDFTVPEEFSNVEVIVYQVKNYSDGPYYSRAYSQDFDDGIPAIFSEHSYYDGWSIGIGENYSEIVTPDKYKRINSLTCSYDPYYNETTFSWDLGEFPSIAKSFAISNYEYSESYYLYSILVDSIDPSLNSKIFSGNLTNENYYFYFEYDDGYYYCLGKFEQN